MDRKQFIKSTIGALVAIPVVSLLSCSSDDSSPITTPPPVSNPPTQGDCIANGTLTSISSNHGHSLTVSAADVQSGVQKNYSFTGGTHNHNVTVSAANFMTLSNGSSVLVTSTSGDGHTHSVTISCA